MKKFLLSILIVATVRTQAREMILEQGPSTETPFCMKYSDAIVSSIYNAAKAQVKFLGEKLTQSRSAKIECEKQFSEESNRDIQMTYKEMNLLAGRCRAEILSAEDLESVSTRYNVMSYVNRFKSELDFVAFHTTNIRAESCESNYTQIARLKQYLNL